MPVSLKNAADAIREKLSQRGLGLLNLLNVAQAMHGNRLKHLVAIHCTHHRMRRNPGTEVFCVTPNELDRSLSIGHEPLDGF
jgi:hypothetical protein